MASIDKVHKRLQQDKNFRRLQNEMEARVIPRVRCMSLVVTLKVLHDEFGFGLKRLCRFLDAHEFQYDCIDSEKVDFDDLKQLLFEEIGIDMKEVEAAQREEMERKLHGTDKDE